MVEKSVKTAVEEIEKTYYDGKGNSNFTEIKTKTGESNVVEEKPIKTSTNVQTQEVEKPTPQKTYSIEKKISNNKTSGSDNIKVETRYDYERDRTAAEPVYKNDEHHTTEKSNSIQGIYNNIKKKVSDFISGDPSTPNTHHTQKNNPNADRGRHGINETCTSTHIPGSSMYSVQSKTNNPLGVVRAKGTSGYNPTFIMHGEKRQNESHAMGTQAVNYNYISDLDGDNTRSRKLLGDYVSNAKTQYDFHAKNHNGSHYSKTPHNESGLTETFNPAYQKISANQYGTGYNKSQFASNAKQETNNNGCEYTYTCKTQCESNAKQNNKLGDIAYKAKTQVESQATQNHGGIYDPRKAFAFHSKRMSNMPDDTKTQVESHATHAANKLGNMASNAKDQVESHATHAADKLGNMASNAKDQVESHATHAADKLGNMASNAKDRIKHGAKKLGNFANEVKDQVESHATHAANKLGNMANNAKDQIESGAKKAGNKLSEMLQPSKTQFETHAKGKAKKVVEKQARNKVTKNKTADHGDSSKKQMETNAKNDGKNLQNVISPSKKQHEVAAKSIANNNINNFASKAKQQLDSNAKQVKSAASNFASKAKQQIDSNAKQVKNTASKLGNAVGDAMNSMKHQIEAGAKKAGTEIRNMFNSTKK